MLIAGERLEEELHTEVAEVARVLPTHKRQRRRGCGKPHQGNCQRPQAKAPECNKTMPFSVVFIEAAQGVVSVAQGTIQFTFVAAGGGGGGGGERVPSPHMAGLNMWGV